MDAANKTARIERNVDVGAANARTGDEEIGFSGDVAEMNAGIEAGLVVGGDRRVLTDVGRGRNAGRRENDGCREKY